MGPTPLAMPPRKRRARRALHAEIGQGRCTRRSERARGGEGFVDISSARVHEPTVAPSMARAPLARVRVQLARRCDEMRPHAPHGEGSPLRGCASARAAPLSQQRARRRRIAACAHCHALATAGRPLTWWAALFGSSRRA
jgi:hypothetical protein